MECSNSWNSSQGQGSKVVNNKLDIHTRTIVNESKSRDSSKTSDGEGKFKFTTRKGVRVGGIVKGVQGCPCLDVQKFQEHSTKVGPTPNWIETQPYHQHIRPNID
jgi:hypothetical protein